jgi:hypothetical protein
MPFLLPALHGALAGTVATLPMSALMLASQKLGKTGQLPPGRITDDALDAADVDPPRRARKLLAALSHFAFGAACGLVYGALTRGKSTLPRGLAFGTAVYLGSYAGWIPALGILPPPEEDRHDRQKTMLLAHWLFGAVLALAARRR